MKKIFSSRYILTLFAFALCFIMRSPTANATWTYYSHSMPYVVEAIPTPAIGVTLSANPASLTLPANQTTLTWTTSGAPESCDASNAWLGPKTPAGGTQQITGLAAGNYVFEITCHKTGTSDASASALVVVSEANTITATLVANPTSIMSGQSSILTWTSTNATSCTGTNFATGGATGGSLAVSPATTTTYAVTCTGTPGSAQASATVAVTAPTEVHINYFQPKDYCLASGPNHYPQFAWVAENATSCTITRVSDNQKVTVGATSQTSGGVLAPDGFYYKTIALGLQGNPTAYRIDCSNQSYTASAQSSIGICSDNVDFTLSATPTIQTLFNSTANFTVTANPISGFGGTVALSLASSPLPAGTSYDFTPATLTCNGTTCTSSTLTVTTPAGLTSGVYTPIVITGQSGTLNVSRTASVTINATGKKRPIFKEF